MAVQGNTLAAYIDYLGLEIALPKSGKDLGLQLAIMLVPGGKLTSKFEYAVKELELNPKLAKLAVEEAKRLTGRGGADNVLFDLTNGDIVSKAGEIIGNLFDHF